MHDDTRPCLGPRVSLLALAAWLLALSPLAALRWAPVGPFGGYVTALTQAPSAPQVLYAGTETQGVFQSADGGATWAQKDPDFPAATVQELAVDPRAPQTAFAFVSPVSGPEQLLRTRDGGAHWTAIGPPLSVVAPPALDPKREGVLYFATYTGLYRSLDGGERWQLLAFPDLWVSSVAIDPRRSSRLYAVVHETASNTSRVWKSADGGQTWSPLPLRRDFLAGLTFDPADPGTLYAAGPSRGFRTRDGGASWVPLAAFAVPPDDSLELWQLVPAPNGRLYAATTAGIFRSADQGATWQPPVTPSGVAGEPWWAQPQRVVVTPQAPQVVYAASRSGVWKSTDGGDRWRAASRGITAQAVPALAVVPGASPSALAIFSNGVFRSLDRGNSWRTLLPEGTRRPYGLLAVAPSDPQRLYGDDGSLRSDDGGRSWQRTSGELGLSGLTALPESFAVDPQNADILYTGGGTYFGNAHHGDPYLVRSRDGGDSWEDVNPQGLEPLKIAVDPQRGATLYVLDGQQLWKSLDGGGTWKQLGQGIPAYFAGSPSDLSIAIDPSQTETVYVGTWKQGVFRSTDGGVTFGPMNCGLEAAQVSALLVDPRHTATLYAGLKHQGVFRWNVATQCWERLGDGLPASSFSGVLALDPGRPAVLYAGTESAGLYRLEIGAE